MGARGLGIVNVSQFQRPILLGQLELLGEATDVAVDATLKLAVVAANVGGFARRGFHSTSQNFIVMARR
jgi:hypothetical protein